MNVIKFIQKEISHFIIKPWFAILINYYRLIFYIFIKNKKNIQPII